MNYTCVKRISQILRHALQVLFRKALCAIDGEFRRLVDGVAATAST